MAAISSRQFMAWPVSASTLAAASSALIFVAVAKRRPFLGFAVGAGAGWPRAAAAGFLALAGRELGEVVLAALMGVSVVANPMEWLPSSGGGHHPPRRPGGAFRLGPG